MVQFFWPTLYSLDAAPPVHVVSNHVDDTLTTANGGMFMSSSASLSSQSC